MRWGGVSAAIFAAFASVGSETAWAEDARPHETFVLFSGVDSWRHGTFLYGGGNWSPGGLDRDGFTLKVLFDTGGYHFGSGTFQGQTINGREYLFQLMPGWRLKLDRAEVKVFAGPDFQGHVLSPDDPGAALRGRQNGLRASFEVWVEPSPNTMIATYGGTSTIARSFDIYLSAGIKVADRFYAGPETSYYASADYEQIRFGVHATAFRLGILNLGGGVGYSRDSDRRNGAYARFDISARR
jgi:Cellulose biosynthesis protein BcsS